jgi:hypothetical protein
MTYLKDVYVVQLKTIERRTNALEKVLIVSYVESAAPTNLSTKSLVVRRSSWTEILLISTKEVGLGQDDDAAAWNVVLLQEDAKDALRLASRIDIGCIESVDACIIGVLLLAWSCQILP